MIVPVIVDELSASESLDAYKNTMEEQYGVIVKECKIAGTRALLLTRPKDADPSCAVHDECSISIVDDTYTLVAKSIDRIYPYGHKYCTVKFSNGSTGVEEPVFVEEKLPGFHVVFTKIDDTFLISTENDIHGQDKIPGLNCTVADFVVKEMTKLHPRAGLDALFNQSWFGVHSWVFQVTPKKNDSYGLVMLTAINMDSCEELSKAQVDNIANYFGYKRPNKVVIYKETQINSAKEVLLRQNPLIDGVILRDYKNARAKIMFDAKALNPNINITKKELLHLASCVLRNVDVQDPLAHIMGNNLDRLSGEVGALMEINKHLRTRRRFAERVSHHPFAKVLFALADNKIENVRELYKVITPYELIRTVVDVDGETFIKAVNDYKQIKTEEDK